MLYIPQALKLTTRLDLCGATRMDLTKKKFSVPLPLSKGRKTKNLYMGFALTPLLDHQVGNSYQLLSYPQLSLASGKALVSERSIPLVVVGVR